MFDGARMVHKGSHGITHGWVPCVTGLGCNTEVGEPKPGNSNSLYNLIIFKVIGHAFGM